MKTIHSRLVLLAALMLTISQSVFAQGSAFTYQGRLNNLETGNPANGSYDIAFSLFANSVGGVVSAGPVTNSAVSVSSGLFTTTVDFGNVFTAASNWLQIAVSTNGANVFSTLTPRQQLTPVPYAITAANVSGTIASANVAGTYGNAVTLNNANNSFSGSFVGNGANVTNVNAATVGGLAATNFWKTTGNTGTAPANGSFIGTTDNQPLEIKVNGLRAMRFENGGTSSFAIAQGFTSPNGAPNVIGGSPLNFVKSGAVGATIGGGGATNYGNNIISNSVAADFGTIGGGYQNSIQTTNARTATIAGGDNNIASAAGAFIGGGGWNGIAISGNTNAGITAVIGGGFGNRIQFSADYSTIGGGNGNQIKLSSIYATIGGGNGNMINSSTTATIGGGNVNTIDSSANYSTIGGGNSNHIFTGADTSTIGGGELNTIQNNVSDATISGGESNAIGNSSDHSTIGGGQQNSILTGTSFSTIGGGSNNQIQTNADFSTIGGGNFNAIQANMSGSTISGGMNNQIQTNAFLSTIGGGSGNQIQIGAANSTIGGGIGNKIQLASGFSASAIGGGSANQIQSFANSSTIGGGVGNQIQPGARFSTISGGTTNIVSAGFGFIGGGTNNVIQTNALASVIVGGWQNKIQTNASFATITGGASNVVTGSLGMISGGDLNVATNNSFAAGHRAKAIDRGAFVWADSQDADFSSTANNEVSFRCAGGVRFDSGTGGADQTVAWIPGSASWSFTSDRNTKENLEPVDASSVLERVSRLPLHEWNYIGYAQRHVGPMAQEFHELFPLNENDKALNDADLHGVALAAIQGLNQKLADELKQKEFEISELKQRLDKLEQLMSQKSGGVK